VIDELRFRISNAVQGAVAAVLSAEAVLVVSSVAFFAGLVGWLGIWRALVIAGAVGMLLGWFAIVGEQRRVGS